MLLITDDENNEDDYDYFNFDVEADDEVDFIMNETGMYFITPPNEYNDGRSPVIPNKYYDGQNSITTEMHDKYNNERNPVTNGTHEKYNNGHNPVTNGTSTGKSPLQQTDDNIAESFIFPSSNIAKQRRPTAPSIRAFFSAGDMSEDKQNQLSDLAVLLKNSDVRPLVEVEEETDAAAEELPVMKSVNERINQQPGHLDALFEDIILPSVSSSNQRRPTTANVRAFFSDIDDDYLKKKDSLSTLANALKAYDEKHAALTPNSEKSPVASVDCYLSEPTIIPLKKVIKLMCYLLNNFLLNSFMF